MSIVKNKTDIASSLSILSSLSGVLNANENNTTNTNIFNNTSKNPTIFILQLLTLILGVEILKSVLKSILNKLLPDLNPLIKNELKRLINDDNSDQTLNSNINTLGFDLPLKDIDYNKKMLTDPTYVNNVLDMSNNSIDKAIYNSIDTKLQQETPDVFIKYNQNNETINIIPKNTTSKNGELINNMIDNTTFVNKELIISLVIDFIFGTLQSVLNKTKKQINDDETYNTILLKIIDNVDPNAFFTINPSELEKINNVSEDKYKGVLPLDFDCGVIDSSLTYDDLTDILNSPDFVDAFDLEIDRLTPRNPTPQSIDSVSRENLNAINNSLSNNNRFSNKDAIRDGLYKNFINGIVLVILKETILSPKALTIIGLAKKMNNPNASLGNGIDLLKNQQNNVICLSKTINDAISTFLFGILKREILKITKEYGLAILNEKLNNYTNILKSLVGF